MAENDFERLQAMFRQSMDMTWLSAVRLDRYKLAWKDADRMGVMVNWYRANRLRIPKPEDVPQHMPELHSDAMRIPMPHLLLWVKNDTALLSQSYKGLTDLCDDVTIIGVTNADNWLHHQVPEELWEAILTWLDK